jgi:uncharacterized membrane-anchored protein YhcB (DUF1043 family)
MDNSFAIIIVAVITAVGAIIVAVIQNLRKENKQDHNVVQSQLKHLYGVAIRTETKLDRVKDELSNHLSWHQGGLHGETEERNKRGA